MATITYVSSTHSYDRASRLRRLQALAWLLDNSILLPGGYRIGLDAIIGLIPGLGDLIGGLISAYIVNEARNMGAPRSVLWRMAANVMVETVLGSIPFAGDVFDAVFKANTRNLALLTRYEFDPRGTRRGSRLFVFGFVLSMIAFVALLVAIPVLVLMWLIRLF